jgi:hypothetical protein
VNPAVATRGIGDEMVLLDLESGLYYCLNEVGACIWAQLATSSVEEVIAHIVEQFDVAAAQAAGDVTAFLDDMARLGLLIAQ